MSFTYTLKIKQVNPVLNGTGDSQRPVFKGKALQSRGGSKLQAPVLNGRTCLQSKEISVRCSSVVRRFHFISHFINFTHS